MPHRKLETTRSDPSIFTHFSGTQNHVKKNAPTIHSPRVASPKPPIQTGARTSL